MIEMLNGITSNLIEEIFLHTLSSGFDGITGRSSALLFSPIDDSWSRLN